MGSFHPDTFRDIFICDVWLASHPWCDITYTILCLHISSSLHQIFYHWQMAVHRSVYQWRGPILIHSHREIFKYVFTCRRWQRSDHGSNGRQPHKHKHLTQSFSFTSFPCSSISDRTAAKSPRPAASHTYPRMNTTAQLWWCVNVSYRKGHHGFDEFCWGERWSDQFQTIYKQTRTISTKSAANLRRWSNIQRILHHTCYKWRFYLNNSQRCNQVNTNATSHTQPETARPTYSK